MVIISFKILNNTETLLIDKKKRVIDSRKIKDIISSKFLKGQDLTITFN